MYQIIWDGEVVDEFETEEEADLMRMEYCLVFNNLNVYVVFTQSKYK